MSDFISALNGNTKGDFKLTADESIAMAELMELFLQKHEDKRVLLT